MISRRGRIDFEIWSDGISEFNALLHSMEGDQDYGFCSSDFILELIQDLKSEVGFSEKSSDEFLEDLSYLEHEIKRVSEKLVYLPTYQVVGFSFEDVD